MSQDVYISICSFSPETAAHWMGMFSLFALLH